jgi:hypothetical protein
LASDPQELVNLAEEPAARDKLLELRQELSDRTTEQGDELKAHQQPYPRSEPLPDLTGKR